MEATMKTGSDMGPPMVADRPPRDLAGARRLW